ncbi:hypothetical protein [Enterococcus sp. AZ163]|uniref:hypothetical protein n=1 Tax=Enterococcus sp. AZ163 TaxID=2774638 RepID=UPI003D29DA40
MKKNNKKKKLMAAAAALALIAAISGTFAWITAQDQRINRAESAAVDDNSVTIVEKWEPKPLVPGTEATKEVKVTNTGTANVYVRVSYEEVLKHLTEKGAVKYDPSTVSGAKYTNVANDPGLAKNMPVSVNGTQLLSPAGGFVEVPAGQITGLEADTKLVVKGGKTVHPTTGVVTKSYEAKMVHEYAPGKYQSMKFAISDDYLNETSLDAKDWTFTVSSLQYGYYENGYKNTVVNWAKSSLPDEAGTVTGNAILGTNGSRHGVNYDYRLAALGLTAIPGETPATAAVQIPTAAGEKNVQADTNGLGKTSIHIKYNGSVVDGTGLAAATDNWIYNKEDGWFYYTQPLLAGQTTANLLDSLVFDSTMGVEYTNASYDLVVKMEAVQGTKEALTDSTGWGITLDPTTKPETKAIYDKLTN